MTVFLHLPFTEYNMKKITPYFLVLASLLLWSCGNHEDENKFTITGKVDGIPGEMVVFLDELGFDNQQKTVDSARVTDKGSFTLSTYSDKEQKLFRVRIGNAHTFKEVFVLNDAANVQISGHWNVLEDQYNVKGSAGSQSLKTLKQQLSQYISEATEMHLTLDQLRMNPERSDSMVMAVQANLQRLNDNNLNYFLNYTDTTKYLPIAILSAIFTSNIDNGAFLYDPNRMSNLLASFDNRFPGQPLVAKFRQMVESNTKRSVRNAAKIKINEPAPNFTLNDVNGKPVSLSSFKGKYVLIDFWAAWCMPCRKENPNVVAAYNEFKDYNFEIIGISLDEDKDKWQEAIAHDKLTWTHLSDLDGWHSEVVDLYGIESIPYNFLIDPDGKIIDAGLTGENLHIKLAEVLK